MRSWLRSAVAAAGMLMALATGTAVSAQQPIPPTHYSTDERGVDLTNGGYFPFVTEVVIGQPGAGGLVYGRSHIGTGWRDSLLGTVNTDGAPNATITVSIGGYSDQFSDVGGTYQPYTPNGSSLSYASGVYTYTTSTGVVATFANTWVASTTPYIDNLALVTSITSPDGERLSYAYVTANMCANSGCTSTTPYARLQSVTNNLGYQIKYEYVQNGTAFATRADWLRVLRVTGLNNGVDYCDPYANTCTFSTTWPSIQYATVNSTTATATDEMSRSTTYRNDTSGRITGVRWPGASADNVTVVYGTDGLVDSVTDATGAWTYDFATVGSETVVEVSGPDGQGFEAWSENGMVQSYFDVDGNSTYILWNAPGQPLTITRPDGSSTEYTYDTRGNITEHRENAATGSGLADIVTTATYPSTCANPVTCNLPTSTTDASGNVTDYAWSSTHGGLLSVTLPEPYSGWDRPQTRIDYDQLYAWYKNSGGSIVQAATAVWRPVETSSCQWGEAPACLGTANERLTTVTYGAASVLNNLLPTVVTTGSGNSSIVVTTTSTYTDRGDVAEVDGPLAGTGDRTQFYYNFNRELVGASGPDPDSGGSLANRAMRITRDSMGLPTLTEQGTTPGYADPWVSFTSLQQVAATYDNWGRLLTQRLQASSTTFSLVQFSYDTSGRLDCSTIRMNPASFASPPAACTPTTAGSYGPDRIRRTTYDDFGRVASVTSGYGVTGAITETLTYTDYGQVETLTDGEGNLTTWVYDGFSRPYRMYYPNPSSSGSSTTDYEQITYDADGVLYSTRTRDNQLFYYSFNALGQMDYVTRPGSELPLQRYYDLFGQPSVTQTVGTGSQSIETIHDVLGRRLSEEGPLGETLYQWDVASRLTRITWPDTYYAEYLYDMTGGMTEVRENGASSGAGLLAQYTYDDLGRRLTHARGNGVDTAYDWDGGSRLIELAITGSDEDATFMLEYNPAGQVIERALSNTDYAYTADAALSDAYANNGLNQVTAVDLTSVTYDGRGNITGDGTSSWSYDASNRLTGSGGNSFTFDPLGRLYSTTGPAERFQYAGSQIIAAYNSSGVLIERYVPGAGLDDYAGWTTGTGGGITRQWPIADPLGSVIARTDGSGDAAINRYDEYGVPGSTNGGRFGYAGALGLTQAGEAPWHMRNRQYHAELGRFLQTDPIGIPGGVNLYAYVSGDPVNLIDPFGFGPKPDSLPPVIVPGRLPPCDALCLLQRDDLISALIDFNSLGLPTGYAGGDYDEVDEVVVIGRRVQFIPPTNPAQPPPSNLPRGFSLRVMPPGSNANYPDGYWRIQNSQGQYVDPSTMRPPGNVTRGEFQARTHVPLPTDYYNNRMYSWPRRGMLVMPYFSLQLQGILCRYGLGACDDSL